MSIWPHGGSVAWLYTCPRSSLRGTALRNSGFGSETLLMFPHQSVKTNSSEVTDTLCTHALQTLHHTAAWKKSNSSLRFSWPLCDDCGKGEVNDVLTVPSGDEVKSGISGLNRGQSRELGGRKHLGGRGGHLWSLTVAPWESAAPRSFNETYTFPVLEPRVVTFRVKLRVSQLLARKEIKKKEEEILTEDWRPERQNSFNKSCFILKIKIFYQSCELYIFTISYFFHIQRNVQHMYINNYINTLSALMRPVWHRI